MVVKMEHRGLVSEIRSVIDYARDFLKENQKPNRKEAIDMLEDVLDDVEWCINNLVKDEDIIKNLEKRDLEESSVSKSVGEE